MTNLTYTVTVRGRLPDDIREKVAVAQAQAVKAMRRKLRANDKTAP